jgi:flagellar motility protein MotE (MotC chaperone)
MKLPRYARLLPSVVLVGTGLLILNATGLIHDAYAGIGTSQPDAMAPPPASANKDFANDDSQTASASEVDVLTSLSKRRSELDTREAQLQVQANVLAATEARVDAKIAQLKTLQSQINALLGQRDQAQEKQLASLVKTYSAMKPKDAARIFDSLDNEVLVPVAQEMKSDVLAPVLAAMNPEQAQKLTVRLANRLTLPETTAAPAAPAPEAAAAPKPAQSAKAAPKTGG